MESIEFLEKEVASLKKDNFEIRERLAILEGKKNILEESNIPESLVPKIAPARLDKKQGIGLTSSGKVIIIILGILLCLTLIGAIVGIPLIIWGIAARNISKQDGSVDVVSNTTNAQNFHKADVVAAEGNVELMDVMVEKMETRQEEKIESAIKKEFSFEEEVGVKWFSRIGILALVIGIGFFIKYSVDMGWINHLARIMGGIMLGISLVIFGEIVSKKDKYVAWGKTLVGGGLAMTYFIVYAAYHFASYREAIGMNQFLDIFLLILIVASAIYLSLKDNSQIIAAESFFLGYVTSLLSNNFEVLTLIYGALLTAGLVGIVSYKKWSLIGLGGIIGSYLMYFLWNSHNDGQFMLPASMLVFYFIAYNAQSFFLLKNKGFMVDNTIIALMNAGLFFLLFYSKVAEFYPDQRSLFTAVMGMLYCLGFVLYKKIEEDTFASMHLYLALFFASITVPIYFNGELVTIIWALEVLLLIVAYIRTDNRALKIGANVLGGIVVIKNLFYDIFEFQVLDMHNLISSTRAISFLATIICFYAVYFLVKKNMNKVTTFNFSFLSIYPWVATGLLVLITLIELGGSYPASATIILSLIALSLVLLGKKGGPEFFYQALVVSGVVMMKIVFYDAFNLAELNTKDWLSSTRMWTFIAAVAIFYVIYGYLKRAKNLLMYDYASLVYSWAAFGLLVLTIFLELADDYSGLASVLFGLAVLFYLFVSRLKIRELFMQAVVLSQLLFIKVLFFDSSTLHDAGEVGTLMTARWVAYLSTIIVFYSMSLYLGRNKESIQESEWPIINISSYAGTILAFFLILLEAHDYWITIGWIFLAAILTIVGFVFYKKNMRVQGIVIFSISIFKVFIYDIRELEAIYRTISYIILGTILLLVSFAYTRYKDKLRQII